ncbi:hypothetical protein PGT21_033046 [Puccinia graminis f. sp. tritici]|uniref:Uncharacterized protein n=2 Tax=Puccinia graminis f. sp. tritici TaxID=56615 RepID=E3L0T4_PUCGT|nr:uncharacterized protein PGTG_15986 [Puccinia graminis f. sp. tritici CRL 75-36-700-3]EFP90138.2 hypothetical protein PGTG_15986 [Puccinia graminis f. sp. tritici CRL 75-36-700-3]KAA1078303.1 hypothetical protein PGT21_033046 [Puccinia graminis f. sp. tritici]KAA1106731.1 hypothetical protein PGTUg99_015723 [Puccinia graminis f. sp. tritici]
MASRIASSSNTPSSNESGRSLPSSSSQLQDDQSAHLQARPPAARSSSANPYRSSLLPSSGHPHRLSDFSPHTPLDLANHPAAAKSANTKTGFSSTPLNLNMLVHPPRYHSPLPPPSQGQASRSHAANRQSMQLLQTQPSFQTFTTRDPRRETLQQPYATISSGQSGQFSNRQSRHLDFPTRRSNEPANLIQAVRDTPQGSRPNSLQPDSRRVVTGILQSALPPSSRPVPVNTEPVRSMSIAELENRHKAALQKLQSHSNQQVAKSSAAKTPADAQSQNLERQQRHKAAMQKLQAHSTSPAVAAPQAPSRRQSANPPPRTVPQPKPPGSSSDASSKSARTEQSSKQSEKGNAGTSNRRSMFGFFSFKDSTKSAAASNEEPSAKPKSFLSSKKQKKETHNPVVGKVEDDDEDVPLAQLASRRTSYNPASMSKVAGHSGSSSPTETLMSKSLSVPTMMHKMGSHGSASESGSRPVNRPQHPRSHTNPVDNRPTSRISSRHHDRMGGFQPIREDNELMPLDTNLAGRSDRSFQPPRWLDEDGDHSQKQGPRPLIFEDEAKAIRNSKRFWS